MPTVLENTAFDIVERVRLRIAHQKASDTEYAEMRVHGGILGRAFLPLESGVGNQPAPGWVRIGPALPLTWIPRRAPCPSTESCAACQVVVDDAVHESVQPVALPHEFAADR